MKNGFKNSLLLLVLVGVAQTHAGILDSTLYVGYDAAKTAFSALVPNLWCVMGGCDAGEVAKARLKVKVYLTIFTTAALIYGLRHYMTEDQLKKLLKQVQDNIPMLQAEIQSAQPTVLAGKKKFDAKYDTSVKAVQDNKTVNQILTLLSALKGLAIAAMPKADVIQRLTDIIVAYSNTVSVPPVAIVDNNNE